MARHRLTSAAKSDLIGIWNFTEDEWGTAQADFYLLGLEECVELLAVSPQVGRKRDEILQGCRSFEHQSHVVFYRIVEDAIDVLRILHRRMDVVRRFSGDPD